MTSEKPPREVTSFNSSAVLISELTDTKNKLRMLIAVAKQVVHALPAKERKQLLDEMIATEAWLTGRPI